ncbi:MAG: response regulator [Opitutales bacterium]|nr:response regulator [Opitutales bacterium]
MVWSLLVALLVWLGWALDASLPKALVMNPVTALGFLILGAILWLMLQAPEDRDLKSNSIRTLHFLAYTLIAIASLRLLDYALAFEPKVDQWLFPERLNGVEGSLPNRMAPNTALAFLLLGIAALLAESRRSALRTVGPFFTLAVFLLAWLALLGYAYSTQALYGFGRFIPMAMSTAGSFCIVSVGLLCARPHASFMTTLTGEAPGSVMLRRLLVVILTVPPLLSGIRIWGTHNGWMDDETGTNIVTIANMLILTAVVWFSAIRLNRSHDRRKRTEEDLIKARQEAEAASRTKSQFLANMSHELRTPLNSVIGFSEILADETFGSLNSKQHKYIDNITGSGRHLLELINDILDLSKIEADRMKFEPSTTNVKTTVQGALSIVGSLASRKNISVTADVEPSIPEAWLDTSKFKQILYNLLSNAIKFTPDGGCVKVTARQVPESEKARFTAQPSIDSGPLLEVSVEDNGIGISPKDYHRLFKEFEQLDAGYARKQEGTGLGLALTRRLVELHGGTIWAESEGIEGKGSLFRFILPLVQQEKTKNKPSTEVDNQPLVLVAEDNTQAKDLISHHLNNAGYAVIHARNGQQTIEMAADRRPKAITLDILLPDQTGWEVLAKLKADPRTADIPVIIISVTNDEDLAFSLGALECFAKPVNSNSLIAALNKAAKSAPHSIKSVLVVDDDPATVELISTTLKERDFNVLKSYRGPEAIQLARSKKPDLITLDLLMPEVNGFEVVKQLRIDPDTREIPILIYTSKDLTADEQRTLRMQVQGISQKNGLEQFLTELDRLVDSGSRSCNRGNAS